MVNRYKILKTPNLQVFKDYIINYYLDDPHLWLSWKSRDLTKVNSMGRRLEFMLVKSKADKKASFKEEYHTRKKSTAKLDRVITQGRLIRKIIPPKTRLGQAPSTRACFNKEVDRSTNFSFLTALLSSSRLLRGIFF